MPTPQEHFNTLYKFSPFGSKPFMQFISDAAIMDAENKGSKKVIDFIESCMIRNGTRIKCIMLDAVVWEALKRDCGGW